MNLMSRQNEFQDFSGSPFDLNQNDAYKQWRDTKLDQCVKDTTDLVVEVNDINQLSNSEFQKLESICQRNNAAIYVSNKPLKDKTTLRHVCSQFGLHRLDSNMCAESDGISALHVVPKGIHQEYIPYSNHAINWHTDGYYNTLDKSIRAMVLHCVSPAAEGGDNYFVDHDLVYIHLREQNPDFISAFMQADVMTIPPNVQKGNIIRAEQTGPVFSVNKTATQNEFRLHMRYTARTRSIEWKQDNLSVVARKNLEKMLISERPFLHNYRMESGHGLIANNILHSRSKFEDNDRQQRLVYRARFYDRVANT